MKPSLAVCASRWTASSMDKLTEAYRILDTALRTYKPSTVICLFSGGYDSMVTAHLTWRWLSLYGHSITRRVVAIDTLLSADGWHEYIRRCGRQIGTPVEFWANPNPDWYEEDTKRVGFPYTRAAHGIQFIMLKERAINRCHQHYKKHWHDRVMFVTGIRRAESRQRANAPEVERRKTAVWVNPLLYWTDEQITAYRTQYEMPVNPFYDTVGGSGDCQCGWTGHIQIPALRVHAPVLAAKLQRIEDAVRPLHGYGWGERPSKTLKAMQAGQLTIPGFETIAPNLCAGCSKPAPDNDVLDFVSMQRMEW